MEADDFVAHESSNSLHLPLNLSEKESGGLCQLDTPLPSSMKNAAHRPDRSGRRSFAERIGDWLSSPGTARQIHRNNLLLIMFLFGMMIALLWKLGVFLPLNDKLQPSDLDLSGTWKIRYSDNPKFAAASVDTSDWCLINAPNSALAPTRSGNDRPSSDCPSENYPRNRMWNNTYWYRKTVIIPDDLKIDDPALFLGAIKQRGWVYFDGKFLGVTDLAQTPGLLLIRKQWLSPGAHSVAIQVHSGKEQNPGIFHAYPMRISLTSYTKGMIESKLKRREAMESFGVSTVQVLSLLVLLILVLRSRGVDTKFSWLSIYFSGSFLFGLAFYYEGEFRSLLYIGSMAAMSTGLMGFAWKLRGSQYVTFFLIQRAIVLYGVGLVVTFVSLYFQGQIQSQFSLVLDRGVALLPLILILADWTISCLRSRDQTTVNSIASKWMLLSMVVTHLICVADRFLQSYAVYFYSPALTAGMTFVILLLAVEDYATHEMEMAFFGRFIRRGLKDLLSSHRSKAYMDEKIFRGRQVPIMKIDIIGYTDFTFGMPYGVKRIFQDLFFTHVDFVVGDRTFFDKSEGDGSVYYFSERKGESGCLATLESALKIRNFAVKEFDHNFKGRLKDLLQKTPELTLPMQRYLNGYQTKTGEDFWKHQTRVRIALAYGFVDEGLWGLTAQSHYGVEGDLITIVARIEKTTNEEEILANDKFIDALKKDNPNVIQNLDIQWRTVKLKGIGDVQIARIEPRSESLNAS